jgi:MbnP
MKNHMLIALTLILSIGFTACKKRGCTDPTASNFDAAAERDNGSCTYATEGAITLNFTHNINGTSISSSDFNQLNYTNIDGNTWGITSMQYLISDVRFYLANGDSIVIDGYQLIDMSDTTTLKYNLPDSLKTIPYTGIGFNLGFDATDNTSGAYADLDAASWAAPTTYGGGYHSMKFDGEFFDAVPDTVVFQYHNLSTTGQVVGIDTTYIENHAWIKIPQAFDFTGNTTIEIQMDINQWFQTPNTWDLDVLFTNLMSDFSAQLMMKQNAYSVFSVGTVTTE